MRPVDARGPADFDSVERNPTAGDEAGAMAATGPHWIVRRLGVQSLHVLAGNLFTLCVGLPLQIYVSRRLGAGGLGTFSLLEGLMATLAGLLGFGLAQTSVRFIPQYMEHGSFPAIGRFVWRAVALLSISGAIAYFALLGASAAGWVAFGESNRVVAIMGAMIPLGLLTYFAQQCLRGFQEIRYLMIGSSYIQLTVKAVVTVVAFALGAGLFGYAVAVVFASLASLGWLGLGLVRKMREIAPLAPRTSSTGRWVRFAAISYATSLLSLPASYMDRFLLGFFSGRSPVGVLAVTRQLQQLPLVVYQMLLSVSAPMFAAAHARGAREDCEHLYALTTDWAVKAALPLILFLELLAHPVLGLFGSTFADQGTQVIRIFIVAQLINMATGPNGNVSAMCGLEKEAFRIDVITNIATAVMMLICVPFLGLIGVSLAVLFNSVVSSLWLLRLVNRNLGIRWRNRRYLEWFFPAAASAALGIALLYGVHHWNAPGLALSLGAMYAAFALASLAQGLNREDRVLLDHVVGRSKALLGGIVPRG